MLTSDFGKKVKKKLVDLDKTQAWLIHRVTAKTGLFMDSSYMNRFLAGRANSQRVKAAIIEILEISDDE